MVNNYGYANGSRQDFKVSVPGQMKLVESKCPNCQAALTYNGRLPSVTCNYCGSTFLVDDLAATTDRILRAQSEAKARDMRTQIEYEKERIKLDPTLREKEQDRKEKKVILIVSVVLLITMLIIVFLANVWIDVKKTEIDERNDAYVEQASEYIREGDYDNALLVANRIDGDRHLSRDQDDKWDQQREELISLIKSKQEASE